MGDINSIRKLIEPYNVVMVQNFCSLEERETGGNIS